MTADPIDTAAALALADAATPGSWGMPTAGRSLVSKGSPALGWDGMIARVDAGDYARSRPEGLANAAFIAAARTGWPAACREIDRLRAENERLRALAEVGQAWLRAWVGAESDERRDDDTFAAAVREGFVLPYYQLTPAGRAALGMQESGDE